MTRRWPLAVTALTMMTTVGVRHTSGSGLRSPTPRLTTNRMRDSAGLFAASTVRRISAPSKFLFQGIVR